MKDLMAQPIYNFLISAIDEIQENLAEKSYGKSYFAIMNLYQKITISDYAPFEDYQEIIQDLQIQELLMQLFRTIDELLQGNTHEEAQESVREKLNELKACAHFLNFLDCQYASSESVKKQTQTMLRNTAIQMGVVFKEIRAQRDCSDNVRISTHEKGKEPLVNPSELENYHSVIDAYIRFTGTEQSQRVQKARDFAQLLFEDLETISKDSIQMNRLKSEEANLFCLGNIEAVVTLSNEYKNEFKQLIAPNLSEDRAFRA